MSSKAGYLKEQKNIGHLLQQFGQQGANFYDNAMVQTGFGAVGRAHLARQNHAQTLEG